MEKKYVTTIVLEHIVEEDEKNSIVGDLSKRLLPKGNVPITVDQISVQEAPANLQPAYTKLLLSLGEQYKQQQEQYDQAGLDEQYEDQPEPQPQPQPQPQAEAPPPPPSTKDEAPEPE